MPEPTPGADIPEFPSMEFAAAPGPAPEPTATAQPAAPSMANQPQPDTPPVAPTGAQAPASSPAVPAAASAPVEPPAQESFNLRQYLNQQGYATDDFASDELLAQAMVDTLNNAAGTEPAQPTPDEQQQQWSQFQQWQAAAQQQQQPTPPTPEPEPSWAPAEFDHGTQALINSGVISKGESGFYETKNPLFAPIAEKANEVLAVQQRQVEQLVSNPWDAALKSGAEEHLKNFRSEIDKAMDERWARWQADLQAREQVDARAHDLYVHQNGQVQRDPATGQAKPTQLGMFFESAYARLPQEMPEAQRKMTAMQIAQASMEALPTQQQPQPPAPAAPAAPAPQPTAANANVTAPTGADQRNSFLERASALPPDAQSPVSTQSPATVPATEDFLREQSDMPDFEQMLAQEYAQQQ